MSRHVSCAVLLYFLARCAALPAHADAERFPFTYGWMTAPQGERELELRHTQPASARSWQDEASVEVGVTPRYTVEPYLIYNKSGAAYRYGGVRLEQRYRFGEYRRRRLLSAAYVEYENQRGTQTAETKYIGQFDPTRQSTLVVNVIQETPISHGGPTEWGYSVGGAYLADRRSDRFWYGAEAFGSWSGSAHWAGPSAGFYLNSETRLVGTYGWQYKGTGGDKFQIMLSHELK